MPDERPDDGRPHDDRSDDDDRPDDTADLVVPSAELAPLLATVQQRLLRGERNLTREDVAERSETPLPDLQRLWRALGFAGVADDAVVFTDADLDALENVRGLKRVADVDDDLMVAMVRIIGQSFARLASWQGQLIIEIIERSPDLLAGGSEDLGQLMDLLIPTVERIQNYVWRRQLAAVFERMASNAGLGAGEERPTVVGFVDMAGFTSFTRSASEGELRGVLTAFETLATDVVGAHGGQIIKTIGDEVLFVCPDPEDAADTALTLLESAVDDPMLPNLRAGLAYGAVVSRLGDVYGQTVNIASRLTSLARTGTVLVDDGLADALRGHDALRLHPLRTTSVRGYHHLHPWRLRRASSPDR